MNSRCHLALVRTPPIRATSVDEEFDEMAADLAAVLTARMGNRPDGARRRRLVTTVHLPGD